MQLAGDLGVALRVMAGRKIQPGGADAPVSAQGLGQFRHLFPFMPVVPHGDQLDDEARPRFLQVTEALHDLFEASGMAGDVVVCFLCRTIEGDHFGSLVREYAGDFRGDEGPVGVEGIGDGLPGQVLEYI